MRATRKDIRLFSLVCVVLGGMGQGVVAPNIPVLLQDASSLALASGLSGTLMYLGIYLTTQRYGKLADQGKFHRLLSFGLLAYAGCLAALGFFSGTKPLMLIRFCEGLTLSAIFVAADFALGRLSPLKERGRWLSFYGVALSAGLMLGPLLSLGASDAFAFFGLREPWMESPSLPLFISAAIAGVLGVFAWPLRIPEVKGSGRKSGFARLNRHALLIATSYGFMEAGLVAVFPVLARDHFFVRPETCLIVVILSAAVSSIVWGTLSDRHGSFPVLRLLLQGFGMGSVLLVLFRMVASPETLAMVSCVFFGTLAGGIYPVGFNWLLESVPESQYGRASGGFARSYGLGSLVGPIACGVAAQYVGVNGVFLVLGAVGALTLLTVGPVRKEKSKRPLPWNRAA